METKYKIEIPKPCNENWDKMTLGENGRFCGSCMKNVVDFTNMSATEIQNYLLENQRKSVCGRFKQTQLDTITIQIPQQILFSQMQFQKAFLFALLLTMGTTLLSCSDKNGEKKKIDKVEIVEDSNPIENITIGVLLSPDSLTSDKRSIQPPPPPPPSPKIDEVKFVTPNVTGKTKLTPKSESKSKKSNDPIVLTEAVVISEKDSLKKQEK